MIKLTDSFCPTEKPGLDRDRGSKDAESPDLKRKPFGLWKAGMGTGGFIRNTELESEASMPDNLITNNILKILRIAEMVVA